MVRRVLITAIEASADTRAMATAAMDHRRVATGQITAVQVVQVPASQ